MIYKATSWKKPRRVVVIRKAQRSMAIRMCSITRTLDLAIRSDRHQLKWEPLDVWRFYNQRCCMENYIKEAKNGFSIDRIATSEFEANELDLVDQTTRLQSVRALQARLLRTGTSRLHNRRFRLEFFHCAGVLVQHSRQTLLKLQQDFHEKLAWSRMLHKVALIE